MLVIKATLKYYNTQHKSNRRVKHMVILKTYSYAESPSEPYITTMGTKDKTRKNKIMCFGFVFFVVRYISGVFSLSFPDNCVKNFKLIRPCAL